MPASLDVCDTKLGMILRPTSAPRKTGCAAAPEPAFDVFLRSQNDVLDPLPVLQSAHCHLAGELAAKLLPEVFGSLPEPVIEAIRQHDYGWIRSDMLQLENGLQPLRSFLTIAPAESTAIWGDNTRLAESVSPLAGALVSRHFCTIARNLSDPTHAAFRERETARRLKLEKSLPGGAAELERWTGAIGFCDLLSLYLCSGAADPAELPVWHPFDGIARSQARRVTVQCLDNQCRIEPNIFPAGTHVSQYVMASPARDSGSGHEATMLEWKFT